MVSSPNVILSEAEWVQHDKYLFLLIIWKRSDVGVHSPSSNGGESFASVHTDINRVDFAPLTPLRFASPLLDAPRGAQSGTGDFAPQRTGDFAG